MRRAVPRSARSSLDHTRSVPLPGRRGSRRRPGPVRRHRRGRPWNGGGTRRPGGDQGFAGGGECGLVCGRGYMAAACGVMPRWVYVVCGGRRGARRPGAGRNGGARCVRKSDTLPSRCHPMRCKAGQGGPAFVARPVCGPPIDELNQALHLREAPSMWTRFGKPLVQSAAVSAPPTSTVCRRPAGPTGIDRSRGGGHHLGLATPGAERLTAPPRLEPLLSKYLRPGRAPSVSAEWYPCTHEGDGV